MDLSDEYQKMCGLAQEIQNFEPNIVLGQGYEKEKSFYHNFNGPHIWLPRQDQLQEIISEEPIGVEIYKFNIFNWELGQQVEIKENYNVWEKDSYNDTGEKLWLRYVMWKKFDKLWDVNKEEWKEI